MFQPWKQLLSGAKKCITLAMTDRLVWLCRPSVQWPSCAAVEAFLLCFYEVIYPCSCRVSFATWPMGLSLGLLSFKSRPVPLALCMKSQALTPLLIEVSQSSSWQLWPQGPERSLRSMCRQSVSGPQTASMWLRRSVWGSAWWAGRRNGPSEEEARPLEVNQWTKTRKKSGARAFWTRVSSLTYAHVSLNSSPPSFCCTCDYDQISTNPFYSKPLSTTASSSSSSAIESSSIWRSWSFDSVWTRVSVWKDEKEDVCECWMFHSRVVYINEDKSVINEESK